jgi:WD40 repeat protein
VGTKQSFARNRNGLLINTLLGHNHTVYGVAKSPDSKKFTSVSWDKTVKWWNIDGTLSPYIFGQYCGTKPLTIENSLISVLSAASEVKKITVVALIGTNKKPPTSLPRAGFGWGQAKSIVFPT